MTRPLALALTLVLGLAVLAAACSDDDDALATPTPDDSDDPALAYVWHSIGGPLDAVKLREYMTDDLSRRNDDDAAVSEAIICFPTDFVVTVTDTQLTVLEDSASIVVTYQVTAAGAAEEPREVVRTWSFVRDADGEGWAISDLPECPYEPGSATPEPSSTPGSASTPEPSSTP